MAPGEQIGVTEQVPQALHAPAIPAEMWRMLSARTAAEGKLPKGLDALWDMASGHAVLSVPRRGLFLRRARRVVRMEKQFADLSDARLKDLLEGKRETFRLGREKRGDLDEAFALVREAAFRTLGMKPYPVQLAAGFALNAGCIVEMATGEGKTLAATVPATIAGWRGRGCHILTVNDYLAARDAQTMRPLYRLCGLRVAHIDQEMAPPARRDAYLADITYCTNKEVTADYLRDRLALGRLQGLPSVLLARIADGHGNGTDRLLLRGLNTAIIDEADSILIDEAVTPLIISGEAPNAGQVDAYVQAATLGERMVKDRDYRVNLRYREVKLTNAGRARLAEWCDDRGGIWSGYRRSEELAVQALTARELFLRDKQYVIQDEKVVIVDEFTGRLMPDRSWRHGLHQAVEAKEHLEVQPPKDTLARVSFQRFFRLYKNLSGMTGTAWEARHELWQIYHRPSVILPTHRPCIREQYPDRIFGNNEAKWRAVVEEIARVHKLGRPILIGTRSVEHSEHLGRLLVEAGLEDHQILNAVRHAEEAQIVAGAGGHGRITVATNMAGRGTDIKLARGVAELGGLHVIATERHESGRIDRQLFGRAARQGDPGSAIAFVSLEDELVQRYQPRAVRPLAKEHARSPDPIDSATVRNLFSGAQARAEHMALRQRKAVLRTDDWLDEFLGFAGREM